MSEPTESVNRSVDGSSIVLHDSSEYRIVTLRAGPVVAEDHYTVCWNLPFGHELFVPDLEGEDDE